DHLADRTRREAGDGLVQSHHRAGLRQAHCRGRPCGRAEEPCRDRGLSWRRALGKTMADTEIVLRVTDLQVAYGGIQAVKGVTLEVRKGELVTRIGANGAGKTTTLKAITGLLNPASGEIAYMDAPLNGVRADQRVARGLVMIPEGRGVF